MLQDERGATHDQVPMSAIERVQRELAETRAVLQGETSHLSQLQSALEQALEVARGVRLEAITELDRLAGDLMDAARRDAAAIRGRAEDDARAMMARADEAIRDLRAQANTEIAGARAAADADAAAQRAMLDRRVRSAEGELDRIQFAWATAAQVLTDARRSLLADLSDAVANGTDEPSAGESVPGAPARLVTGDSPEPHRPAPEPVAEAEAAPVGAVASAVPSDDAALADWPAVTHVEAERASAEGAPSLEVAEPLTRMPLHETTDELATPAERIGAVGERVDLPAPEHGATGWEPMAPASATDAAGGGLLGQAAEQLRGGDVPAALDTYRGIVDRSPDEIGGVITQLTAALQERTYAPHHEEIRLLLVDAYMVQGDYDRAMSLLHEPAGG